MRQQCSIPALLRLAAVMVAATPGLTAGAQTAGPWDGPAFSLEPKAVIAAAAAVRGKDGDPIIYLIDEESYRIEADCSALYRRKGAYKILLQAGVDRFNSISCGYQPWRQDKPSIRARVITPAGTVYSLDQSTLADRTARESKDVYSDARSLTAPLPGLEVGAVVEFELELRDRAPLLSAGAVYRSVFGYSVPVIERRLTVDCDSAIPIRYARRGLGSEAISTKEATEGGRKVTRFSAKNLEAIRSIEEYIPRDEIPVPCVDFSTAESWGAVAAAYGAVAEPFIDPSAAAAFAREALGGADRSDRKAAISAVMAKILRDIRYTGINFGENAIIPHSPADTIARGYGDCKDQSVLAVSALRSLGIEARIALLDADLDSDVREDLPGFGLFNHVIVYMPEDGSWIDPTASYFRPGELPPADLGRKALVIAPGTTALTPTPAVSASVSRYREVRAFTLADSGPASVVETTTVTGVIEADYRYGYASSDPESQREHLEKYVKDVYRSDRLDTYTFTNVKDLSASFTLNIEASKTERASTDLSSAVAILQSGSLFNFLPRILTAKPEGKEKKRSLDVELPYHYVAELEFVLSPPPGFRATSLPEPLSISLGPARLESKYTLRPDGVVIARFEFDPVKSRYAPAEAHAMREAILQYYQGDAPKVIFEQVGESLLSAGKYREALDEFRGLAARFPKKALHHIQISRALEAAGFGYEAREEALKAVQLEPDSADAHDRLAWTYLLDPFGHSFETGCSIARALKEYAAAARLDPSNARYTINQAILSEYGDTLVRYGRGSNLEKSLALYEGVRKDLKGSDWENNPLYVLLRLGRFSEMREAARAASNKNQKALFLCATAAIDGPEAAIREAARVASATDERREALVGAASMLMIARRYSQSAELMKAGAVGSKSQTQALALAAELGKIKPLQRIGTSDNDPKLVMAGLAATAADTGGDPEALDPFFAKSARASLRSDSSPARIAATLKTVMGNIAGEDLPPAVIADLVWGFGETTVLETGPVMAVLHRFPAFPSYGSAIYYLKKEDGELRIVDVGTGLIGVSREILALLSDGSEEEARAWFSLIASQSERDKRFTSLKSDYAVRAIGDPAKADAAQMRFSASLALARSSLARDKLVALPGLLQSIESLEDRAIKTEATRLATLCLKHVGALKEAADFAERLWKLAPKDSYVQKLYIATLDASGQGETSGAVISSALEKNPNSADWLRIAAEHYAATGNYAGATAAYLVLIDRGLSKDGDVNNAAWYALFAEGFDYATLEKYQIVQKLMSGDEAEVHTLACVLADSGRLIEAQEALRKYLSFTGINRRSPSAYLAFGLYAEAFGLRDSAAKAYKKAIEGGLPAQGELTSRKLAELRLHRIAGGN